MTKKCSKCGRWIDESVEYARIVNRGLEKEKIMCEDCFDGEQDCGRLVSCEACGEWFVPDALHDEALDEAHTFTPCPCCGKDIVSGLTREEMAEDAKPLRYAVIVTFVNGYGRGYLIHAHDRLTALRKTLDALANRGAGCSVASIAVSEVLLDDRQNSSALTVGFIEELSSKL